MIRMLAAAGLAIGLGLGTAACTDGYGRGGVAVGYGGYGDGYGGYGDYAGGYYGAGYGWYGDYYYPGTGYYVYDRYRRPYRWNDSQQRYWQGRRGDGRGGQRSAGRGNWDGFAPTTQNGYRYREGEDRRRAQGYRDDGYRARADRARPGDTATPADRTRQAERSGAGRTDAGLYGAGRSGSSEGYGRRERPAAPPATAGRPQGRSRDRH